MSLTIEEVRLLVQQIYSIDTSDTGIDVYKIWGGNPEVALYLTSEWLTGGRGMEIWINAMQANQIDSLICSLVQARKWRDSISSLGIEFKDQELAVFQKRSSLIFFKGVVPVSVLSNKIVFEEFLRNISHKLNKEICSESQRQKMVIEF